ncbi:MAG: hypothetical protein HN742_21640 [Lentisphaerae bacterium]|jgi:hypothetical protein|nr:hypothetical protein [Lentisphaerota bacterium]MBT4819062.1 hypothetical protein [Lentisphaerota bacterium]MBT5608338.1 hypothetical protein [Lentisphaerota bacterium]MBT7057467.1 hypothetical protein [Lentisphaerota bacterium]MBT7844495.1 hypothetical protein [Lentisphaerota bacterium]
MLMSVELRNDSTRSFVCGGCQLLRIAPSRGGNLFTGPHPQGQTVSLYDGTPVTQHVKRITHHVGNHDAGPLCHIYNPASGHTYHAAFLTFDRSHGRHLLTYRNGGPTGRGGWSRTIACGPILLNGGFENDEACPRKPDAWEHYGGFRDAVLLNRNVARSGTGCL